jgi:hypothetical protein
MFGMMHGYAMYVGECGDDVATTIALANVRCTYGIHFKINVIYTVFIVLYSLLLVSTVYDLFGLKMRKNKYIFF